MGVSKLTNLPDCAASDDVYNCQRLHNWHIKRLAFFGQLGNICHNKRKYVYLDWFMTRALRRILAAVLGYAASLLLVRWLIFWRSEGRSLVPFGADGYGEDCVRCDGGGNA